jgi:hypothetical protein
MVRMTPQTSRCAAPCRGCRSAQLACTRAGDPDPRPTVLGGYDRRAVARWIEPPRRGRAGAARGHDPDRGGRLRRCGVAQRDQVMSPDKSHLANLMALFGVLGYVFARLDCEPAPLLLGFILGPIMEEYFRRAMTISGGDTAIFVQRPISAALFVCAGLAALSIALPAFRRTRKIAFDETGSGSCDQKRECSDGLSVCRDAAAQFWRGGCRGTSRMFRGCQGCWWRIGFARFFVVLANLTAVRKTRNSPQVNERRPLRAAFGMSGVLVSDLRSDT